jgi:hypothetical protein
MPIRSLPFEHATGWQQNQREVHQQLLNHSIIAGILVNGRRAAGVAVSTQV